MDTQSDGTLEEFLAKHPLKERWLDDIINVLLYEPRGTAHVTSIAKRLSGDRNVSSMEQTITRRINDFCSDAADFNKATRPDLFQRVEPATYRLRSFPEAPDTLEAINIEFDDAAMQTTWDFFASAMQEKHSAKWATYSNRQRLTSCAKWPAVDDHCQRTKDLFELD